MQQDLLSKKCVPCEGGTPPLSSEEAKEYLAQVSGWTIPKDQPMRITKDFKFSAKSGPASGGKSPFMEAMAFVNKVAEVAEKEGHHPNIHIFYNRVQLELWTHAVEGLSENDFILAAKIDALKPGK